MTTKKRKRSQRSILKELKLHSPSIWWERTAQINDLDSIQDVGNFYGGFDPGSAGAFVLLSEEGALLFAARLPLKKIGAAHRQTNIPDSRAILPLMEEQLVGNRRVMFVTIEESLARNQMSITRMFNYGRGYGVLYACADLTASKVFEVMPKVWQKQLLPPKRNDNDTTKDRANRIAKVIWPELTTVLDVKANQGIADAALVAEYGRWKHLGLIATSNDA